MTRGTTGVLLALALLAPLPSFAIGRDLSTPRIATPGYNAARELACTTESTARFYFASEFLTRKRPSAP